MNNLVPGQIFFTKGVGRHKEYLSSFEAALRDAQIAACNLVTVSSILPPGCERVSVDKGSKLIAPGQITFAVMARNATNEPGRLIAAAIGCAQPAEDGRYGYLSEHHSFGENDEVAGEYAEDLAATMLASTLGIDFDVDADWDEREMVFKMSGQIVETFEVTQSATGEPGLWTTVISCGVFLP